MLMYIKVLCSNHSNFKIVATNKNYSSIEAKSISKYKSLHAHNTLKIKIQMMVLTILNKM